MTNSTKKTFVSLAIASGLALGSSIASAEGVKFGVQGAIVSGGDTLASGTYTNGGSYSVEAGSGTLFGVYALVPMTANDVYMKLALGSLKDTVTGSNGEISFSRMPIDFILSKKRNKWQYGAGITYHLSPEYERYISGYSNNGSISADNALGFVVEANYTIFKALNIGVRYTSIDYNFEGVTKTYDGSGLGLTAGITF